MGLGKGEVRLATALRGRPIAEPHHRFLIGDLENRDPLFPSIRLSPGQPATPIQAVPRSTKKKKEKAGGGKTTQNQDSIREPFQANSRHSIEKQSKNSSTIPIQMAPREAERPPRRHRESGAHRHKRRRSSSKRHRSGTREPPSEQSSHPLSAGALERLNRQNAINPPHKRDARPKAEPERRPKKKARGEEYRDSGKPKDRGHGGRDKHDKHDRHDRHGIHGAHGGHGGHDDHRGRSKRRVVSGAILEEGKGGRLRGGALSSEDSLEKDKYYPMPASSRNRKKRWCKRKKKPAPSFLPDITGCYVLF